MEFILKYIPLNIHSNNNILAWQHEITVAPKYPYWYMPPVGNINEKLGKDF